jgi:hypothetical protein
VLRALLKRVIGALIGLYDPTGVGSAVAGTLFDRGCEKLDAANRRTLDTALAKAEQELQALLDDGVREDDREPILTNAAIVLRDFGPRLSEAPEFGLDAARMAEEAVRRAGEFLRQSEDRIRNRVPPVVEGVYRTLLDQDDILRQLRRHIDGALLDATRQHGAALAGLPEALREATLKAAAAALLELPMAQRDLRELGLIALLRPEHGVVPFAGRDDEVATFTAWCLGGEDSLRLALLVGQGGEGKTRLALELARRFRHGWWDGDTWRPRWHAGLLGAARMREASEDALRRLASGPPALAVIDEAQARTEDLLRLLRAWRAGGGGRFRILCLSRGAGEWWDNLLRADDVADLLQGAATRVTRLRPLAGQAADRMQVVKEAAAAFAARLGDGAASVPDSALSELAARTETVLELHVGTLLASLGEPTRGRDLVDALLKREEGLWLGRLCGALPSAGEPHLRAAAGALAAVTLTGAASGWEEARKVASCSRAFAALPAAEHDTVLSMLGDLYGPALRDDPFAGVAIAPLRPDRVGETLVAEVLDRDPSLLDALLDRVVLPAQGADGLEPADRLLTVLARIHDTRKAVGASQPRRFLDRALSPLARAAALAPAAVAAAQQGAWAVDEALAASVRADEGGARAAALATLRRVLPHPTTALRESWLAVQERAVAEARARAAAGSDEARNDLAGSLNDLSVRLSDLGRREAALAAIEEAVAIRRTLAQARPDAFLPDLALSLNNLSGCLADLGRREAALAASEGAVAIRRTLAQARPDAFLPDLAASLNTLSNRLSALGRREAALAASEEAVAHYRTLAQARPDAFLPDLAGSLNNQSNRLSDLGRREAALAAIEEAVVHYRTLAQARPDAFLPDLAMALNNQSNCLSDLGRREAALAASEEAVAHYRTLAQARPDAFLPDLAASLGARGTILHEDDPTAAAGSFREGIALLAPFFTALPHAHALLMATLCRGYVGAARAAGQPIDTALLDPIVALLQQHGYPDPRDDASP